MTDIASVALFLFGLLPQYVSIFFVEKYYTNYWTAFWNVFGVGQVTLATLLGTQDLLIAIGLALLLSILMFVLCLGILSGSQSFYSLYLRRGFYANILRRLGASWLTTTVSIGLFFGLGLQLDPIFALVVIALNAMLIGVLYLLLEPNTR